MASLKERKSTSVIAPSATPTDLANPKVSLLRRTGRSIARHPRIIQSVILLLLFSGTGIFLLYSLFKGAWSPHQDNVGVLRTILRMELSQESARAIEEDPQQIVTRSYQSLEPHVANDGWVWINRFGSTITYGKQDQRLIASCSAYSPLYLICSLSEIP